MVSSSKCSIEGSFNAEGEGRRIGSSNSSTCFCSDSVSDSNSDSEFDAAVAASLCSDSFDGSESYALDCAIAAPLERRKSGALGDLMSEVWSRVPKSVLVDLGEGFCELKGACFVCFFFGFFVFFLSLSDYVGLVRLDCDRCEMVEV